MAGDVRQGQSSNRSFLLGQIARVQRKLRAQAARYFEQASELQSLAPSGPVGDQPTTFEQLCRIFILSDFEQEILLLCAGAELAVGWGQLCGAALGESRRRSPTFELAQAIADAPHWSAFSAPGPLRRWRLIEVGAGDSLMTSPLRIDERVLAYLLGIPGVDPRLTPWLSLVPPGQPLVPSQQQQCDRIVLLWRSQPGRLINLWGPDLSGQLEIAATACRILGRIPYQLENFPKQEESQQQLLVLWQREQKLTQVGLLLKTEDDAIPTAWLGETLETAAVLSRERCYASKTLGYGVMRPTVAEQRQLWQQALADDDISHERLTQIAGQFDFSTNQIHGAIAQARNDGAGASNWADVLWAVCRVQARPVLDELAQRLTLKEDWDDLILPDLQKQALKNMVAGVRSQYRVYHEWGFAQKQSRGFGISALFAGISGTGKTMAAGVIARTLELELYRVDLSAVVSKYIGETEKNLRQIFDAAESGSAVLLFDEADALFGKRSEVRDSHDRYANMEVSYLLQRMEAYRGVAILTTNLKESIDPAFIWRLQFIVKFPAPDFDQRLAIWQRVFPAQTPTQDLNYRLLAKLNVTGGLIRNIALTAAFLAADQNQPVTMEHLLQSARWEYSKLERPIPAAEIKGWCS